MANNSTRKRRPRGSLSQEQILQGAFEVAKRDGLDRLSMPVLAAQLDVGVTSIYWYFRSKDDLLRNMSTRAMLGVFEARPKPQDRDPAQWQDYLRDVFTMERAMHAESPLLTDITLMGTGSYSRAATDAAYDIVESSIEYLVSAGFSAASAWNLFYVMSIYVRGFIITERNRRVNATPPQGLAQLDLLNVHSVPLVAQLVSATPDLGIDGTGDTNFEAGLNSLLDMGELMLSRDTDTAGADNADTGANDVS